MQNVERCIRILLVDDHSLVRSGVRAILELESDLEVVGESESGESAIEMARVLHPDLVIMDLNMPGMSGIETTRRLKSALPSVAVIVLTVNDEEIFLINAVKAGAASYLLKDRSSKNLIHSIRVVAEGGSLIPLDLLRRVMHDQASKPSNRLESDETYESLSDKEMDVLVRLVRGMSNQEIADDLFLAKVTVKKRIQSIFAKLQVSDRTQAALKAVRLKLTEP